MTTLYLASASPRRRQLLAQLGVEFSVLPVEVDETWDGHEPPADYTKRLARDKALAGRAALTAPGTVIGADTAVVVDGHILGKPEDDAAASSMLGALSGRVHEVYSAVAVAGDRTDVLLSVSRVHFRALDRDEIATYCRGGEPLGKAGGYAIQGFAAAFIEHLEGSYSGVMGLPLFETAALLARLGVPMGRATAP